jgi:hypothetical protein
MTSVFKKQLLASVLSALCATSSGLILAQPDRTSFVVAPFMQRAYEAEARQDWAEVRRQAEQALRRAPDHVDARLLLINAMLGMGNYEQAEAETLQLPSEQQAQRLSEARARWATEAIPPLEQMMAWRSQMAEGDWLQLMQSHLLSLAEREGSPAALRRTVDVLETTWHETLVNQMIEFIAADSAMDDVLNLMQAQSQPQRQIALAQALILRLIFLERNEEAKRLILNTWSLQTMPEEYKSYLVELAQLTDDVMLMSQPDLRDEAFCLDSVAWVAERDPEQAGQLLAQCDRSLDAERWQYLASQYNPGLLPSVSAPLAEQDPAVIDSPGVELELMLEAEARQRLAQRRQDAVDAAYRGECELAADTELDSVRDEVNAICLRQSLPGVASVYFELVLADEQHPRRSQLLREAAYNAYQAGDYQQALMYWQQVSAMSDTLTADEQRAIEATRAAQAAALAPVVNPDDIAPASSINELRALANAEPQLYGLEFGLRLSGNDDPAVRAESIGWLESARERDPYDFRIPETLAYRYHEIAAPAEAIVNAELAIDAMDTSLAVGGVSSAELDVREFSLRRTHQYLTQRNRFYFGGSWSRFGALDAIGASPRNSSFQIASFEHLLGEYPDQAGRQLGVYGRVLGSGTEHQRYFENPALGLGLRWKPWGSQNVNLFAELFEPDNGDTDLMLRASASLLDSGDLRDDWRPQENSWQWQSLYLDAAWFARADTYQLYASYSRGIDFKLESRPHLLSPYVTLWSGYTRDFSDTAAGMGIRYRHWLREDTYNAWRNRIDIRFELYRSVSGDRRNNNGWRIQTEWML